MFGWLVDIFVATFKALGDRRFGWRYYFKNERIHRATVKELKKRYPDE